ncbi:hypothetical protein G7067_02135 [Leucobacter insecticola]|uniref:Uncharacterized protein n=1 Tax=Leucobacter insecticola TaxID=2714934 RepID=A0A6G8FGA4_9MICO|nr:hypothetical protein [Leucobacter insecticola]QIM15480.1 hypothetical protein G7067_02135 [Leucobacter insecticola]
MACESSAADSVWRALVVPSEARANAWVRDVRAGDAAATDMLEGIRRDPENFEFTRRLIELVAGTEDAFASALGLREMAQDVPPRCPCGIAWPSGRAASLRSGCPGR